jgi:hypothetical protein
VEFVAGPDHLPHALVEAAHDAPQARLVLRAHRPGAGIEQVGQVGADRRRARSLGLEVQLRLGTAGQLLDNSRLWEVQATAIRNLEASLRKDRPRALIQMATGSGKTFTAANLCYRLIRHADAKRILFLVDRPNLGKQTKLEFDKFVIADTQRRFPAEYVVQHLASNTVDSKVAGSTGAILSLG